MLDLSAKISSFRKMVWSNEKRKSEKELYDSTDFSSKTLNEIKDNLDKNYKLYIEKRKFQKALTKRPDSDIMVTDCIQEYKRRTRHDCQKPGQPPSGAVAV